MSTKSFKVKKSLNIEPQSAPTLSEEGDLGVKTGTALQVNISSSVRDVLTADQTQTVTNKTIDGSQNTLTNIPYSSLVLTGLITDADISATAAISDSKLAQIKTANKVANSATTGTNSNTANTLVLRDASGNFAAGTITGSVTGHASLDLAAASNLSDVGTPATAFNNISGFTALGDTHFGTTSGQRAVLAGNTTTTKKFLRQTGTGAASAAPVWDTVVAGDITSGTIAKVNGGTGADNSSVTYPSTGTVQATTPNNHGVMVSGSGATATVIAPDASTAKALISGGASADPTWGVVSAAGGGTGQSSFTKGDILVATGSTTLAKLGVGSDGQVTVADSSQSSGVKWTTLQQGAKNYITYGNFENNATTGWSGTGCATITNGLPVTVGTGAAAFSSSNGGRSLGANTSAPAIISSGQLSGSYSLSLATTGAGTIGDGYISQAYNIDISDQSKNLGLSFNYKSVTGSPVMAGTSSNTYAAAVYDMVNNAWLPVVGAFNFVQGTGVGRFYGTVQTLSNTVGVQVFVYSPVAPIGASSLYLDDFVLGPQVSVNAPVITDWNTNLTFTPNNFGTISNSNFYWKREGDTAIVTGTFTAGTTAGSAASITLPFTIDSTKLPSSTLGTVIGSYNNNSVGGATTLAWGSGNYSIFYDGSDTAKVYFAQQVNTTVLVKANGSSIAATGNLNTLSFRVPVVGWSSNTAMSSDSAPNVVAASAYLTGSQTGVNTNNTNVLVTLNTTASATGQGGDTNGSFSTSTSLYTIPVTGWYQINGGIQLAATNVLANLYAATIRINGTDQFFGSASQAVVSQSFGCSVSTLSYFTAGTTVGLSLYGKGNNSASTVTINGAAGSGTYLNISRQSGSAVVAQSETVAARYTSSTSTITNNGSAQGLVNSTKDFDTHGAVTSGIFTAPKPGIYTFSAGWFSGSSATSPSIGREWGIGFFLNGTAKTRTVSLVETTSTLSTSFSSSVTDTLKLAQGDTVQPFGIQNVGTGTLTLDGSSDANFFSVRSI